MPVTYKENIATKTIELVVNGKVTQQDWDDVAPKFEKFLDAQGTIRLIEIIESLKGFDPILIWEGIKMDIKAIPRISHCAIVSDIGWISPISKAAGAFMPMQLRTFEMAQVDAARAWIAAPDGA